MVTGLKDGSTIAKVGAVNARLWVRLPGGILAGVGSGSGPGAVIGEEDGLAIIIGLEDITEAEARRKLDN